MMTNPLIVIALFTGYAVILMLGVWVAIEIIEWLYDRRKRDEHRQAGGNH